MFQKVIISFIFIYVAVFSGWVTNSFINSAQNQNIEVVTPATTKQINSDKLVVETTATTTKTSKTQTMKPKPVVVMKKVEVPQVITITIPEPAPDFEKINTSAREATLNILCTTKNSSLSPISGTGIVISSDGLILTNAHVAQYFLLRDLYQKDFIECVVRTGSPAYPRYHVELVYISPTWVEANKTVIKSQDPIGTGERDYAFLRITDSIDGGALPVFSYLPPNTREKINLNEPVVLVSYPAGFLGGLTILQDLSVTSAITSIQDVFTFKENTIDIVAVGGTVISQKGASGGAVVDKNSSLVGIISTSSTGDTTSSRDLNAITLAYINRSLQNEINMTLSQFLSQDIVSFAKNFQETKAPALTKILTDEIIRGQ